MKVKEPVQAWMLRTAGKSAEIGKPRNSRRRGRELIRTSCLQAIASTRQSGTYFNVENKERG